MAPRASSAKGESAVRFQGFADKGGRFFEELTLHNHRDWFEAHRDQYQEGWLQPMQTLFAEVRGRLARVYPGDAIEKPKVFRIHRDIRFSKDKTPYKTHIGGLLTLAAATGGRSQVEVPAALYFHVSHTEIFAAAGLYGMDPGTLASHRRALLDPRRGRELDRILAALRKKGFAIEARESLKRPPPGVDPEHPRVELLRMKGLIAVSPELPRKLLASARLVDRLAEIATACAPLNRWLLRVCG
ncbi:MAG: DUF2461 domain-containing protein [Deltaproteobacteria bacterium]|nr:DUF2461 domain-containing protein [Deltaproteobacteria bacterium]